MIDYKLSQPINNLLPNVSTELGKIISFILLILLNALSATSITLGIFIVSNELQLLKAEASIEVTLGQSILYV